MHKISHIEPTLLNIGYAEHNADWNFKHINSPFTRIFLVLQGSARVHLPNGVFTLTPNHLYIIPPFTMHSYECDGLFSLFYIHIYEAQESDLMEQFQFPFELQANELDHILVSNLVTLNPQRELKHSDPAYYDNSQTLLETISIGEQQSVYSLLSTKGILLQLLGKFIQAATPKMEITDARIKDSLVYIRKNIHLPIRIDELAQNCFLSNDHYIRLFKKELNCTPIQYINQKKIERAQLLLSLKKTSVKEIAYMLSFDNISYFNRLFKSHTGKTPKKYLQDKILFD